MQFLGIFVCVLFTLWTESNGQDERIIVNDTVIGDPLITVPILVSEDILKELNIAHLSLCYEIHGYRDEIYNLVSDECVSINAHYYALTYYLNVIDQIGVRVVDEDSVCRNIKVDVNDCIVSVDDVDIASSLSLGGINVSKSLDNVRISVPTCNDLPSLVMWITCETRTLKDPFGNGDEVTGEMLKFEVARGLNFGHEVSHGLLGQFWNIPMSIEPFAGLDRQGKPVPERYVINITSSMTQQSRSFTGRLYDLTWSFEEGPCLYAGSSNAGPIYAVKDPNQSVIEGNYFHYLVPDLFSEEGFEYGLFQEELCLDSVSKDTSE